MNKNHQFHLVDPSPWPLVISFIILNYTLFSVMMMNMKHWKPMIMSMILILWVMFIWWRDVQRESTFQGTHTSFVMISMKYGMLLFIVSEILFFFSFFWSFFHHVLSPSQEIGLSWPPFGIFPFNPLHIPLINTVILLSSGVSITWAHSSIFSNNLSQTKISMIMTIILGIYFSFLQAYEYMEAPFCVSDSVYGSTFFVTTGFHGIHVIIGTMFLSHSLMRLLNLHFSKIHHLGMEMSIWYWHFVDVVWLFLYISIYWWGK
uniref:Cytochrome c oxidase subunit 3 n=1 Tax=Livia junci TaxID=1449964 RepID=A0A344A2I8_9HEMI|nr:cytochrome c oxidase subunit III [Livia junci]AWU48979.1 cytochrome c oxidase subunit 3 [Livia junci]